MLLHDEFATKTQGYNSCLTVSMLVESVAAICSKDSPL